MTATLKKPSFSIIFLYATAFVFLLAGLAVFHFVFHFSPVLLVLVLIGLIVAHGVSVFSVIDRKAVMVQMEKEQLSESINLLKADIEKSKGAIAAEQRKMQDFIKLRYLVERLSKSFSLEQTARTFARELYRFFDKAHVKVFFYLFHPQTGQLMLEAAEGARTRDMNRFGQGDVFDSWVIRTHQPLVVPDTHNDYRFKIPTLSQDSSDDAESLMIVPLRSSHNIFGILRLESDTPNFFNTNDLRLFATAGELGSVAVENASFYEQLLDIAVKDGLTGLYLRQQFLFNLEKELSKRIYLTTGLSLIMLDLDHFKSINDRYGHTAGDIVLKWVGVFLLDFCKERGLMGCRYGGEEFCILIPHSKEPMAFDLAEKIRMFVERHEFVIRREKFCVSVSIGVASYPDDAKSPEPLIHAADQAMYMAKKRGRNRVYSASSLTEER